MKFFSVGQRVSSFVLWSKFENKFISTLTPQAQMATRVLSTSLVRSFIQGPDSKTTFLFQAITLGRGDGTEFADGKRKQTCRNVL